MVIEWLPSSDRAVSSASLHAQAPFENKPRLFRYVDEPLCIGSMALYLLNRWVLKPHHIGGWFTHGYLNDVICLPIFLPIILRLQSALGIRRHDLPPTLFEVLQNSAVFTIVYQFVLPRLPMFVTAGDPWDSVAYLTGGLAVYLFWNRKNGG